MNEDIHVSREGRGDFSTISAALRAAEASPPGPVRIIVAPGEYREKLTLLRPGLRLEGSGPSPGEVRILWDDHARRLLPDGEAMGTFNSYVVFVGAPDIRLSGLDIENTAGDGRIVGQAVALYADADRLLVEDCRILARQDSLCTGPLPHDPLPKGVNLLHPVAGLGEDEPRLPFRQIYRNCLVAGDVDFIFGSAAALFERCEIRSIARGGEDCFIAAPSTWPGQRTGFLFRDCVLSFEPEPEPEAQARARAVAGGEGISPRGKVYLGRPWRPCAKACFVDCHIGDHISPEGWQDWDKPEARILSFFGERGSSGPGAPSADHPSLRVAWARHLEKAETDAMYREIASFLE